MFSPDLDADDSTDSDGLLNVGNPFCHTARERDVESGLYHYRHRYYSSVLGRFISRDPARYVDGYSMYAYVSGRATGARDGKGLAAGFEGYGGGGMAFLGG